MKQTKQQEELSVLLKPWIGMTIALLCLAIYGFLVWIILHDFGNKTGVCLTVMGIGLIFPVGLFITLSATKVTVDSKVVALRLGGIVLRRIPSENVRTLIVHHPRGVRRSPLTMLVITTDSAEQLEMHGENALGNGYFTCTELRFLTGRADWKDICLGAGLGPELLQKHGIWIEFSPERQARLEALFPNCAFRVSRDYHDPPSVIKNEESK